MKNGFSLVELIVVIGIMMIIMAVAIPIYGNLQISSQVNENSTQIAQTIKIAEEQASGWLNNAKHGVKFQPDRYTLFQGTNFATRQSAYDREVILDSALSLSTNLANNEIVFNRGLGRPNNTGTITLTHVNGSGRSITVNSFGMVEEN